MLERIMYCKEVQYTEIFVWNDTVGSVIQFLQLAWKIFTVAVLKDHTVITVL